ncbi:MAG: TetR family transcriptional regulator [Roseiarcus sp.]
MKSSPRPYVMTARADAAAATRTRLVRTAAALLTTTSFDEMTLEAIAAGAGTTARTALRIFGGKEMLIAEALRSLGDVAFGPVVAGDLDASVRGACDLYEKVGDMVIRWLADEARLPAMREHLNVGRRNLRAWVAASFAPTLARLDGDARRQTQDALIVAFDIYTWKLLRRDFGLGRKAVEAVVRRIVAALTRESEHGSHSVAELVGRRQSAAEPRHRARADRART